MRWELEWGPSLPMFRSLMAQGREVVALTSRPIVAGHLRWFMERFLDLSAQRQHGFAGPQPLPMSEMLAYGQACGLQDTADMRLFLYFMQAMDRVFLDWARKQKPAGK